MRISPPTIEIENGEVVVSTRVLYDRPLSNKPDRLWFALPERFAPHVTRRSDAFAAGLIVLAMHTGEDLVVEGELSPRLARGLTEYQQVFSAWFPDRLKMVRVQPGSLSNLEPDRPGRKTITLFSGGVDSAYTMLKHLPPHQPLDAYRVRYALFIHGYDIPLQNRASFDNACETFSRALEPAGVELIPLRTNLRYFTSGLVPWLIAHGSATIAAGLVLDGLCRSLLVPATHCLDDFKPWGSSPMVDHWLSTGTIEVVHHGVDACRMEKVQAISGWEPAQNFLRVCINEAGRDGVNNCSRCEKCMRTMIMLAMCGTLERFKTFSRGMSARAVLHWVPHYATSVVYTPSMRRFARQTGQNEYLLPLAVAHLRGLFMFILRRSMPKRLFNFLKKQKYPYERDPFNPAQLERST